MKVFAAIFVSVFVFFAIVFSVPCTSYARSDEHHDRDRGHDRDDRRWGHGGYYHAGWYDHPCIGFEFDFLPYGYRVIHHRSGEYFYYDGVYYVRYGGRYRVVEEPVYVVEKPVERVVEVSQPVQDDGPVTVNIPNKKGGYTAVVVKRSGNGYVGPQGEYYDDFPKVTQLQAMYGN